MPSWLIPSRMPSVRRARVVEATPAQILSTGAAGGSWGPDGPDDRNWRPAGSAGRREVPEWTREKARIYSIAGYRTNPMVKAIVDTYTSFCVGDKGVSLQITNPRVREIADEFWTDPRNALPQRQDLALRSMMLNGERLVQLFNLGSSGRVRIAPIDPALVVNVTLVNNNAGWPEKVWFGSVDGSASLTVAGVDDATGLRSGDAMWWTPWLTTDTDTRSVPFLMPILDWLDSYDTVLSNLIDRTALARYMVWDVTVEGGQPEVDEFIRARGGLHVPPSGSVEVHNQSVTWRPQSAPSGAMEDTQAATSVLTLAAAGSGLARHWLADPEDANRATAGSMAEPVRRRVQGVQRTWLDYQTEQVRYAVDRAVAARRLPAEVEATDPRTGMSYPIPAAQCVTVTGPEIAAADAQITAQTLLNISTGLQNMVTIGVLSPEAARVAARKAWEDFCGIPYTHDLDSPDVNRDDIATYIDEQPQTSSMTPEPSAA